MLKEKRPAIGARGTGGHGRSTVVGGAVGHGLETALPCPPETTISRPVDTACAACARSGGSVGAATLAERVVGGGVAVAQDSISRPVHTRRRGGRGVRDGGGASWRQRLAVGRRRRRRPRLTARGGADPLPPQISISFPVQTATGASVSDRRAAGAATAPASARLGDDTAATSASSEVGTPSPAASTSAATAAASTKDGRTLVGRGWMRASRAARCRTRGREGGGRACRADAGQASSTSSRRVRSRRRPRVRWTRTGRERSGGWRRSSGPDSRRSGEHRPTVLGESWPSGPRVDGRLAQLVAGLARSGGGTERC